MALCISVTESYYFGSSYWVIHWQSSLVLAKECLGLCEIATVVTAFEVMGRGFFKSPLLFISHEFLR